MHTREYFKAPGGNVDYREIEDPAMDALCELLSAPLGSEGEESLSRRKRESLPPLRNGDDPRNFR